MPTKEELDKLASTRAMLRSPEEMRERLQAIPDPERVINPEFIDLLISAMSPIRTPILGVLVSAVVTDIETEAPEARTALNSNRVAIALALITDDDGVLFRDIIEALFEREDAAAGR
jgi:hypothetical protein